jgi:hypothetical protein
MTRYSLISFAIGTVAILPAAAASKFTQLSGSEIVSRFSGMEFTDGVHWAYTFDRNGRTSFTSMGHAGSGKWRVNGNQLCYDRERGERCFQVWVSGNEVQLRTPGSDLSHDGVLQRPDRNR